MKTLSAFGARSAVWLVALLLTFGLAGCVNAPAASEKPAPLLLISLDGFRWDYIALHPAETPHLRRLMKAGVSAERLIPAFPSQTFTSHYSIATGLYPANHGIIGNRFFDPVLGTAFNYRSPASLHDPRFWGGEPIWSTAVKQGRRSACYFWAGAEVNGPLRPSITKAFDYKIPFEKRVDELMSWLSAPENERPAVTVFYLEETNSAGHYFGPDSPEVLAAIKLLDERIGKILERVRAGGIPPNIVIVSDHGMAPTDGGVQTVLLDDHVDLETVQVDFDGSIAGLRPLQGTADDLAKKLSALPAEHYRVYRSADLPARWHLKNNPRIPDVWVVPVAGWRIQQRSTYIATKDYKLKGDHGYDNAVESMHGILIAQGPAFKSGGRVVPATENVNIYNLLCAAAGLTPAPNDGDDRLVRTMLR